MSLTVGVQMPVEDRAELTRWTRSPSLRAGLAQRARIVLLADEGVGTLRRRGRRVSRIFTPTLRLFRPLTPT
jgi:hypothetical protein